MRNILRTILVYSLLPVGLLAQLGDRKDKDVEQIDPIPAEKIPPAPFLNVDEALKSFDLAEGFLLEPVATEPWVENPIALAFDPNGRIWVVEMRSYMPDVDGNGEDTPNGRIRVLEDTDGDGQIDKATDFLDDLVLPRVVAFSHGGVIFNDGDALYFTQRDGLTAVGERELIDVDYAKGGNVEHKANGMLYGHDNWFYNAKSSKRYRRVKGKWQIENTEFRGQFGISKDNAGRLFYNSNSTLLVGDAFTPTFLHKMRANQIGDNRVYPSRINPGVNRAYREKTLTEEGKLANATAACGPVFYRGDNFPAKFQNYTFVCESSANLVKAIEINGIKNFAHTGIHPFGQSEFLTSTDERFRPVNAYTGPDGSLMIVDMYHGLIQHKAYVTTYLRKQYISRGLDKQNNHAGRIYRVRWSESPASELPQLEGLAPTKLVPYLAHPNGFWRDTAQRLIVETGDASVVPQINTLAKDHTKPLGQIHALWTLEGLNAVNNEAVQTTLRSSNRDVLITALEMAPLANHATEILEACIQVPDTHHVHKARCLTRLGLAQAWEHLLPILQSPIENDLLTNVLFKAAGEKLPEFIHFLDSQSIPTAREMAVLLTQAIKKHEARTKGVANNLKGSTLEAFVNGKSIYEGKAVCMGCHGQDGAGLLNLGPPLAQSEWVTGDPKRLIQILLHGLQGPIEVAGKTYNPQAVMPGLAANPTISDKDLAHVISYIRNAWGNKASVVPQTMVEEQRKLTASRGNKLYSAEDFQ